MIEPTTLSVPDLAARWNQTTREILEHAANLHFHLLFNFDGLVFDTNDDWLRSGSGKDWKKRREIEALTDFVESADSQLKRRAAGQLSQWESLGSDEAVSLRAEVTAKKKEIEALKELFDDRDRKRQKRHYRGYLMAAPETVDKLKRLGFVMHPYLAYRPEGPFTLRKVDGGLLLELEGPMVYLEPGIAQLKERLEPADMAVSMARVKAIEAAAKPQQTAPATNDEVPAPPKLDAQPTNNPVAAEKWIDVSMAVWPGIWDQFPTQSKMQIAAKVHLELKRLGVAGRSRPPSAETIARRGMTGWEAKK